MASTIPRRKDSETSSAISLMRASAGAAGASAECWTSILGRFRLLQKLHAVEALGLRRGTGIDGNHDAAIADKIVGDGSPHAGHQIADPLDEIKAIRARGQAD